MEWSGEAGCGLYQAHPSLQLPQSLVFSVDFKHSVVQEGNPQSLAEIGLELTTLMVVVS